MTKKNYALFFLLFITSCKSNIFQDLSKKPTTQTEIARQKIKKKKYGEAEIILKKILRKEQTNDEAKELLVSSILKKNEIDISQIISYEFFEGTLENYDLQSEEGFEYFLSQKLPPGNDELVKVVKATNKLLSEINPKYESYTIKPQKAEAAVIYAHYVLKGGCFDSNKNFSSQKCLENIEENQDDMVNFIINIRETLNIKTSEMSEQVEKELGEILLEEKEFFSRNYLEKSLIKIDNQDGSHLLQKILNFSQSTWGHEKNQEE